jgi:hypothetical protein
MRNDTIIHAADLTIILTGETRTIATVTIGGRKYSGEVGNPIGRESSPEQWMDHSLLRGLYNLTDEALAEVCDAIAAGMC